MIVTLYIGVIALITLLFQYINIRVQDPVNFYLPGALATIRATMASLIVATPVYLFMSRLIEQDMKKHPEKQEMKVRKWLLYLTLFIASLTIIIDLITLIDNFLSGELTLSFVLKVLVVLAIAVAVFSYYLWDIKRSPKQKTNVPKTAAIGVIAVVVVSIAAGFFFVGSPAYQRDLRLDDQRVGDLQGIQATVVRYWQQKGELPSALSDLNDSLSSFMVPVDPETGASYAYQKTGELSFELCAVFAAESLETDRHARVFPLEYGLVQADSFAHGAGHTCFERTIDPELHADPTKPVPIIR